MTYAKNVVDINQCIINEISNASLPTVDYQAPTPSDKEDLQNYNLDTKGSIVL